MRKIAIYTRCATDGQEGGNSLGEQLKRLGEVCSKEVKTRQYSEVGSGVSMDRPALKKMLADAAKKRFKLLFVADFSRLSRKTEHLVEIISKLQKSGVKIISMNEHERYHIERTNLPLGYVGLTGFISPDGKVGPVIKKKFDEKKKK